MMNNPPLRYRIDSWDDLPQCQSNISNQVSLHVSNITLENVLVGKLISVEHECLGTLFSCVLDGVGPLVDDTVPDIAPSQIFSELSRYGFLIEFAQSFKISDKQLGMLMAAHQLGFDRVRHMSVWRYISGAKVFSSHIVAFRHNKYQDWLNNWYSPTYKEFMDAISEGCACNLQTLEMNESCTVVKLDWSWLYGNIFDIKELLSSRKVDIYRIERKAFD